MTFLLDVNVLLALAWPQHPLHTKAETWLDHLLAKNKDVEIATCPITELGFCRISMNIKGYSPDLASAVALLQTLITGKAFTTKLIPDSLGFRTWALNRSDKPVASQLTDIYLHLLAKKNNAKLATFDGGIVGPAVEFIG